MLTFQDLCTDIAEQTDIPIDKVNRIVSYLFRTYTLPNFQEIKESTEFTAEVKKYDTFDPKDTP